MHKNDMNKYECKIQNINHTKMKTNREKTNKRTNKQNVKIIHKKLKWGNKTFRTEALFYIWLAWNRLKNSIEKRRQKKNWTKLKMKYM